MKAKRILPLLLSLALLSLPLSGCSTPAEETDTATPQPNITTDENGVSTAADLDIVSDPHPVADPQAPGHGFLL